MSRKGKIDLDTDVNQYLKQWRILEDAFTSEKKVTVRGQAIEEAVGKETLRFLFRSTFCDRRGGLSHCREQNTL